MRQNVQISDLNCIDRLTGINWKLTRVYHTLHCRVETERIINQNKETERKTYLNETKTFKGHKMYKK